MMQAGVVALSLFSLPSQQSATGGRVSAFEASVARVLAVKGGYVEHWVDTLSRLRPDRAEAELRFRAHAAFGLLNSTPHSARIPGRRPADGTIRGILEEMTWASLMS